MTMITLFAAGGATYLWLLYIWLGSAIIASLLSNSKGYGEKPGLGTGLLLSALGPIIWLFIPPKDDNAEWHHRKPWQRRPRAADMLGLGGGELHEGETAVQPGEGAGPPAVNIANPEHVAEADVVEASAPDPDPAPPLADEGDPGAGSRPGESRDS
jgi:hypothetical protein